MERALGILMASLLLFAACGGGDVFEESSTTEATTTTAATTTTTAATTTTSAATTTTEATTTTAAPMPAVTGELEERSYEVPPGCPGVATSIWYPVVSGLAPAVLAHLNGQITAGLVEVRDRYATDAVAACGAGMAGDPAAEMSLEFEATTVSLRLISLRFTGSEYYPGAAHPNAVALSMNFDPASGDLLSLDDVLLPGGAVALAALARQHVVDDYFGGDDSAVGGVPPELLDHWVVSAAGLEITFAPYEVGPGAMGAPTVVIPFAELVGILDPASPAGPG